VRPTRCPRRSVVAIRAADTDAATAGWPRRRTARASALARSAPELQAKSRHAYLASLGRYVQLGEQTSAQVTANADPAARRKPL